MSFWSRLYTEARADLSAGLIVALVVTALLLRFAPAERGRLRSMTVLTVLHVVLLPVCALLSGADSAWYNDARLAAVIFEMLAFVGMAGTVLFGLVLPRAGLRAPRILRDVLSAAVAVIAAIAIANKLGFPLDGIITTSAVLTAVIGFSMQDTLGNIMGGLALQMDDSVAVGDWVKVGNVRGRVVEIRWRHTAIETRNWETVIVPNSVLMKGEVVIEGRRQGEPVQLRRWIYFNVDFRTTPADVIHAVDEALQGAPIEHVAASPAPNCILMDLQESYARYGARYWLTDLAADDPTDSVVRTRIFFALRRAGIPLSMPAHAVFLTEESQGRKAEKGKREIERRREALSHVELFDMLDEESRTRLAERLRYAPFARGEVMTRQGAEGHWLYMIIAGDAAVRVHKDGEEREVARLSAGSFFGEMSLLTGAPRTATVVALSDVECYRLDKAAFQETLRARPDIADGVAAVLARRQINLMAVREQLDAATRERRVAEHKHALLHSIREFFGLSDERPRPTLVQ